jgi:hypothetical protein
MSRKSSRFKKAILERSRNRKAKVEKRGRGGLTG